VAQIFISFGTPGSFLLGSSHTPWSLTSSLLQEASIADISYLFEIGVLVDFEVDELVSLIRALFADTPLRSSTINKILGK
jgi:centromere/kinetochore protein ZW10